MTKKIGYSKTYPILNIGVYEKIWIEEEVSTETDSRTVLYALKKTVENFHFESNKADEKKAENESNKIMVEHISGNAAIIKAINSFKEISGPNGLESFKLIVKGKPELETAYNNRLKELT